MDELHIPMIQWMVNLLILMIPDFPDPDTVINLENSVEKHDLGIAKLELDAIALAKKLSQYSSYLSRWNYLVILLFLLKIKRDIKQRKNIVNQQYSNKIFFKKQRREGQLVVAIRDCFKTLKEILVQFLNYLQHCPVGMWNFGVFLITLEFLWKQC